jgi:2-iminoacetate synthase ThiH
MIASMPAATPCPLCEVCEPTTACRFCGFSKDDGRAILEAQRIKIEAGWDALSDRQQELLRRRDK